MAGCNCKIRSWCEFHKALESVDECAEKQELGV